MRISHHLHLGAAVKVSWDINRFEFVLTVWCQFTCLLVHLGAYQPFLNTSRSSLAAFIFMWTLLTMAGNHCMLILVLFCVSFKGKIAKFSKAVYRTHVPGKKSHTQFQSKGVEQQWTWQNLSLRSDSVPVWQHSELGCPVQSVSFCVAWCWRIAQPCKFLFRDQKYPVQSLWSYVQLSLFPQGTYAWSAWCWKPVFLSKVWKDLEDEYQALWPCM